MRKTATFAIIAPMLTLAACKPPPTDAGLDREMPVSAPTYASEPLPSPDTEGALWALSSAENRIIYGRPGEPALLALACVEREGKSDLLRITRIAPADEGAGALMAIIGNGSIGRIEVDATQIGKSIVWQGELPAVDIRWEPLAGPRQATVTVPGAGIVTLNPSTMPRMIVDRCRGIAAEPVPEDPLETTEEEQTDQEIEQEAAPPETEPSEEPQPEPETDASEPSQPEDQA